MKSAVVVFPASNCDRDVAVALQQATGQKPQMIWHQDTSIPDVDLIVLPGGFSHGDYLRAGAMAARAPIMEAVRAHGERGTLILGICNGFQILTEAELLPGALLRNQDLDFVCRTVTLSVASSASPFTQRYNAGTIIRVPIAHHDGNYFADEDTLKRLEDGNRIAFKYVDNPNGSVRDIAGILSENGRILGLMPHPERVISPLLGGMDGAAFFDGIFAAAA
ncbi:MAG: phosphoribosylformylglycinamidine synthase subunit PurQ [Pseudomonadota bacterium]